MFPDFSGLPNGIAIVIVAALIPGMAIGYFLPKSALLGTFFVISGSVVGILVLALVVFLLVMRLE